MGDIITNVRNQDILINRNTSINQNLLVNQTNQYNQIDQTITSIENKTVNLVDKMQNITNNITQINMAQDGLNKSIDGSESKSSKFLGKIKEVAKNIFSLSNAKLAFNATIGGAAKAKEQLIGFQNLMGNKDVGKEYLDKVSKQGIKDGFSPDDVVNNTRGFMKETKNTDKLDKLNNMSARLATTNPSKGVGDSGAAIQSAMSGKFDDLQNKFNFSDADTQILKSSKSLDDFMGKMDGLLNKKGLTAENLIDFSKSPMAQVSSLKSNIESALSSVGDNALEVLSPILEKLNSAFDSKEFESFLNVLSNGLQFVSGLVLQLFDFISWIAGIVVENWGIIEPILFGVAAVIFGVLIVSIMQMAIAWIMSVWPILLIIGVVALLIAILVQCGVSAEAVIGFIGGLFGFLWAGIYNGVAFVWNIIASLAEFFANVFKHPLYSTKTLFMNIWNSIVGFVGRALDFIIGMIKKVPFLGSLIGDFSIVDKLTVDMDPPPDDYYKAPRMETKNFENEFKYGYNKGLDIKGMLSNIDAKIKPDLNAYNLKQDDNLNMGANNLPQQPTIPQTPQMPQNQLQNNFNKTNDNIEKGNDKLDVSNDYLEVLRDLAEIESIQNFVTLTPTVEVTTGDIKEEADINSIITKIETYMKNELVNSAEGVYA